MQSSLNDFESERDIPSGERGQITARHCIRACPRLAAKRRAHSARTNRALMLFVTLPSLSSCQAMKVISLLCFDEVFALQRWRRTHTVSSRLLQSQSLSYLPFHAGPARKTLVSGEW